VATAITVLVPYGPTAKATLVDSDPPPHAVIKGTCPRPDSIAVLGLVEYAAARRSVAIAALGLRQLTAGTAALSSD